ncbi:TetR/AcrR family transcriptional regulator C-terminal domain-containing protein [Streptomyces sp. LP05-1]|uniref:TetR/AcrR family transcriptional regulator C-terminal domain-containing protein n=1 Tax=Streptomyces pyxinae TaxID=2970734 RepID=A0ABT2CIE9_9ACTN|nr:TetR/AcrR family transcriptional regulator C-terminal domain-containing protein [Streptomyces sp. LP05-1]MCS0637182.1 TetR/AcrR family transcriptional regulator C-terminal domain-containing protein [Streptomyces sp. LP05-1]
MAERTDPPYLRIAADLRRRIAAGELAPGDRVPSTRRLAADWGVALATATKALTALRLEGTVEARPRVGTVVAPRPGPARPPGAGAAAAPPAGPRAAGPAAGGAGPAPDDLSRDRIVRAAIAIADAEGLAALTMRGVAARLGVAAMSPYRYVGGREELVLLMADAAFGELSCPEPPAGGWRERLETSARIRWALYRRHPWLAQLGPLTRPQLIPNLLAHGEWTLAALDGRGLAPGRMLDISVLLHGHIEGLAVHLEREAQARAATGLDDEEWMETQLTGVEAVTLSGRFPVFGRLVRELGPDGYDLDFDHLFETGLRAFLDGLARLVEG